MPRIVITTDLDTRDRLGIEDQIAWLKRPLLEALENNGALPLMVSHLHDSQIDYLLDNVHGLLLSGSILDIPPHLFNQEMHELCAPVSEQRSAFELALLHQAMERQLPVLAICGGMQLINVAFGGSLLQDLQLADKKLLPHQQDFDHYQASHDVVVQSGSLLEQLTQSKSLSVNSTHHQVVNVLGNGLEATAQSSDGVVEAIEHGEYKDLLAVQWHPEYLYGHYEEHERIFKWFINKALQYEQSQQNKE